MSKRKARRERQVRRPPAPVSSNGPRPGPSLKKIGLYGGIGVLVVLVAAVAVLRGGGSGGAAVAAGTGDAAPAIEGKDPVTGQEVSLTDYEGKPVVVNIWASWCPGCNDEAEDLRKLAADHPEAQVIGIDIQDTEDGARDFYRRWGWKHPSVFDKSGNLAARYGLQGLPTTVFLDSEHRVVGRIVGAGTLVQFEDGLSRAKAS